MSPRMLEFARLYAFNPNGTECAIQADYSERTAAAAASRLLKNVNVQREIARHQAARVQSVEISQEMILHQLRSEMLGEPADSHQTGRIRAAELLGKHLGMFIERHDVRALHAYSDPAINEVEELVNAP